MSAFAGIVTLSGGLGHEYTDERVGRAITARRKAPVQTRRLQGALFVQRTALGAQRPQAQSPIVSRGGRILFVARVRLDNRQELLAALGQARTTPEPSDGALILDMFERWGEAGLARCLGSFALAHWDGEARRLVFARDCIGSQALFFHRAADVVAFATTLPALLALPSVPRDLDEITLANVMVLNLRDTRKTFYRDIERVPSRTLIAVDRAGLRHSHYWAPRLDPPLYRRAEDYVERARELLDQAVVAATADLPRLAISASGGLDSSAIAATAARLGRAESIACYTLVPPADLRIEAGPHRYLDESDKMQALARMHPALDLTFIASETVHPFEQDDTRQFVRTGMPALAPTLRGLYYHLGDAVVADGYRVLCNGQYGNIGLSWNGRVTPLSLFRGGHWRSFADAFLPASWRRSIRRLQGKDPDSVAFYSAVNPDFIAEHDLVARWRAQGFDRSYTRPQGDSVQTRTAMLFDRNQFARDNMATTGELTGFEMRAPLADRRLLEFTLNVPEPIYRRDGVSRAFGRAVLSDRLPREILQERRRGAQDVTWFRRLDIRRKDIAEEIDRLEGSALARRLIDLPRLKRLMDDWPADEWAAENRKREFRETLAAGVHMGRFIRWVEGGNA